jgi:hypothetical protein
MAERRRSWRAALGVLLAFAIPVPADAATHATVLARPGRSVAVVALANGNLARVRLPHGATPGVGVRVVIRGRVDKVGTLVARVVRRVGTAGRVRIAGTVVGLDGGSVLVGSGGGVVRVVTSGPLGIGTGVVIAARFRGGLLVADTVRRRAAPTRLRLAGVVSALGVDVVVLRLPGGANAAIGSGGRDVSWLKPGQAIVVEVTRRGARLSLRRYALLSGRDALLERPRGEVIGQVASVDGAKIAIARLGRPQLVLTLPTPAAASSARNGDTVLADTEAATKTAVAHVIVLGRAVPAVPPSIELRSAPPAVTPATTVVIEWAARGAVDRQVCSLDGAPWTNCTSPRVVPALAKGAHVVAIAARNARGWAPRTDVRFTVAPPPPSAPVVTINGGAPPTGYATSASFPFAISGVAASTLCSLDGAPWATCVSPRSVAGLSVGSHIFAVTAGNAGGWNLASRRFVVLALPAAPTVTLTQQPASSTSATSGLLAWTTTGTVDSTLCSVDAGAFTACASPLALNALTLGSHSLTVRVANDGGSAQASAAWTVIAPPPGAPTVTISAAPFGSTTATTATVSFAATGTAVTTTCSLDGAAAAPCSSPWVSPALALGAHTVTIVATNAGGSATAVAAWSVVPAAPTITLTTAPAGTTTSATATIAWNTAGTVTTTHCSLDAGPLAPCTSPASWSGLGVGPHSVTIRVANAGGSADAVVTWTVAVTAPTVAISSAPPASTPATSATIAWVATGTVSSTTCALDGGAFTACTSPAVLTGLAVGPHLYTIKVANAGGYATAAAAWTVADAPPPPPPPVNTGLPVISGVAQSRKTLTATTGTWTGAPGAFTFQWLRCTSATSIGSCTAIAGAAAASYTAATADIDTFLRVQVTATNAGGAVVVASAATPKTMPS